MQVAILAGGLGTRLGGRTARRPKSLVPVRGRPFISYQLELLASHGVRRVIVCVGHRSGQLERYVGDGRPWGLHVRYSHDGPRLLGTAGALRHALPLLDSTFAVLYGDSYIPVDYPALLDRHLRGGRPATVAAFENHDRWDRSNLVLDGDDVAIYDAQHRQPGMTWIDAGTTALERSWLAELPAAVPLHLADRMHELAAAGQLAAYRCRERFYEVGSLAGLAEFRRFIHERDRREGPDRQPSARKARAPLAAGVGEA